MFDCFTVSEGRKKEKICHRFIKILDPVCLSAFPLRNEGPCQSKASPIGAYSSRTLAAAADDQHEPIRNASCISEYVGLRCENIVFTNRV